MFRTSYVSKYSNNPEAKMKTKTDTNLTGFAAVANNLINGNTADAKTGARRLRAGEIKSGFIHLGWSSTRALAAAIYLKNPTQDTYQAYCDAV